MHTAGEKQPLRAWLPGSHPALRQEDLEQVTKDWGSWGSDDVVEGLKSEPGYKTKSSA